MIGHLIRGWVFSLYHQHAGKGGEQINICWMKIVHLIKWGTPTPGNRNNHVWPEHHPTLGIPTFTHSHTDTHTQMHAHAAISFLTKATNSSRPVQLSYDSCDNGGYPRHSPSKVLVPGLGVIQSQVPQKKIGIGKKKS